MDFSSKSISERLFVSEASLSRFAKKCGYRGYREFIYQYEEIFVEKQESITGNTRMILNAYQELLNKTLQSGGWGADCKDQQISESGGACVRVRNWKFRSGSKRDGTAFYANRCGYWFAGRKRYDAYAGGIPGQKKPRIRNQYQRIQGRGLVSSERSISERCETILFTANNRGGFEQFCTEVVLIPSLRHLNHGNVISPQFPILVMLDIIYSYYLEQDKYEKEVLHDNTLRALEEGEGMHRSF